jgi:hypothetical protein
MLFGMVVRVSTGEKIALTSICVYLMTSENLLNVIVVKLEKLSRFQTVKPPRVLKPANISLGPKNFILLN